MVIPLHDANPTRRRPVVTWALVLVNVVVFLISPLTGLPDLLGDGEVAQACVSETFLRHWAAIPRELVGGAQLPVGVGTPPGYVAVCRPSPFDKQPALSVLTAMFLHGGGLHLAGNMLYLWIFGNNVEDRMGRLRFLLFYLGCGYVATYGFALLSPGSVTPLVGASGAIAGVLGAYLWLFPRARVLGLVTFFFFLPVRLPAWLVLGFWFGVQYLYFAGAGVADGAGVAYAAHVIGFVVGLLVAALVMRRPPRATRRPPPPPGYGWG